MLKKYSLIILAFLSLTLHSSKSMGSLWSRIHGYSQTHHIR